MRFSLILLAGLALGATSLAAQASDWTYDPSAGPAGEASTRGSKGTRLVVGCNSNGVPAYIVKGAKMPNGEFNGGVRIDDKVTRGHLVCNGGNCAFSINDRRVGGLSVLMRAGTKATITGGGERLDNYSLIGSAAAMAKLATRGCNI